MEDKKLAEARQREERNKRLAAGLREITYHPVKALILFLYMLTLIWAWMNKGKVLTLLSGGYPLLYHGLSLALLLVALLFLAGIIITLGTPRRAAKIQAALVEAGFVNSSRLPPLLISVHKAEKGYIYELSLIHI